MGIQQSLPQFFPCHPKNGVKQPTRIPTPSPVESPPLPQFKLDPVAIKERGSYILEAIINEICPCIVPEVDMKKTLHRSIGVITSIHPIGKNLIQGTGFLISDNLVLTCAHNICHPIYGKKQHQCIKFYPAAYGKLKKPLNVIKHFFPKEYLTCENSAASLYDYALLRLEDSLDYTQFMPLGEDFEDFTTPFPISIFGYPSSQKFKDYKNENGMTELYMWQAGLTECKKIVEDTLSHPLKRVAYQISTEGGQSGSPIVIQKQNSAFIIIGLHLGGGIVDVENQVTSTVAKVQCNLGRRITGDVVENLKKWKLECQGAHFDSFSYKTYSKSLIRISSQKFPFTRSSKIPRESAQMRFLQPISHSKYWHLNTPFTKNFFINNFEVTRMYLNNLSFYQTVSLEPLPSSSTTRYKVQSYGGKSSLIFGIVAQYCKFSPWSKGVSKFSVGFLSFPKQKKGAIFNEGREVSYWNDQLFIEEGDILTMNVSKPSKTISFSISSKPHRTYEVKLGQRMVSGNIFAYTSMKNKDCSIKILINQ